MRECCVEVIKYSTEKQEYPRHYHVGYEILLVEQGEVLLKTRGMERTVQANSLILLNHLEEHEVRVLREPYTRYYMILDSVLTERAIRDPELLLPVKSSSGSGGHVFSLSNPEAFSRQFSELLAEYRSKNMFRSEMLASLVEQLFIQIHRLRAEEFEPMYPQNLSTVTMVQNYLDTHFREPIRIGELAARFYLDQYYLAHLFKSATGYTMKEYLTLTRLAQARSLLRASSMKINEICFECGFSDVNSFIRYFRREYQVTPLVYRKESRREEQGGEKRL